MNITERAREAAASECFNMAVPVEARTLRQGHFTQLAIDAETRDWRTIAAKLAERLEYLNDCQAWSPIIKRNTDAVLNEYRELTKS